MSADNDQFINESLELLNEISMGSVTTSLKSVPMAIGRTITRPVKDMASLYKYTNAEDRNYISSNKLNMNKIIEQLKSHYTDPETSVLPKEHVAMLHKILKKYEGHKDFINNGIDLDINNTEIISHLDNLIKLRDSGDLISGIKVGTTGTVGLGTAIGYGVNKIKDHINSP